MEKTLFAADELSGFVIAVALVRPSRAIGDVDVPSVLKKMKDKAFARAVRRDDITRSAEELGVPLEEHVGVVIEALKGIASELGLEGTRTNVAAGNG
jgi:predicted hydrolase (HD superfamily)